MKRSYACSATAAALVLGLTVSAQPVNDLCSGLVPVQILPGAAHTFVGTTVDATYAGDATSGPLADGTPKVWHAFTLPVCSDITLAYCGSSMAGTTYIVLSTNCPSSAFVFNDGVNITDCADGNWTYLYNDLPAGTYYAPVGAFSDFIGEYELTITAANCNGGAAPANDGCNSLAPVNVAMGTTRIFAGNTVGATYAGDATSGPLADGTPKVWHPFTIDECANLTLSYCGSSWVGTTYIVISTNCPSSGFVFNDGVNISDCDDANWTYFYNELPAGTYYAPVGAFADALGPYQLNITAEACSPNAVSSASAPDALLSPNPTTGPLRIELPGVTGASRIVMIDPMGREVVRTMMASSSLTVDLSGLVPGPYHVLSVDRSGLMVALGRVVKE